MIVFTAPWIVAVRASYLLESRRFSRRPGPGIPLGATCEPQAGPVLREIAWARVIQSYAAPPGREVSGSDAGDLRVRLMRTSRFIGPGSSTYRITAKPVRVQSAPRLPLKWRKPPVPEKSYRADGSLARRLTPHSVEMADEVIGPLLQNDIGCRHVRD